MYTCLMKYDVMRNGERLNVSRNQLRISSPSRKIQYFKFFAKMLMGEKRLLAGYPLRLPNTKPCTP